MVDNWIKINKEVILSFVDKKYHKKKDLLIVAGVDGEYLKVVINPKYLQSDWETQEANKLRECLSV